MTDELMRKMMKDNPQQVLRSVLYSMKITDYMRRIDETDLAKLDEVDLLRLLTEVISIIKCE